SRLKPLLRVKSSAARSAPTATPVALAGAALAATPCPAGADQRSAPLCQRSGAEPPLVRGRGDSRGDRQTGGGAKSSRRELLGRAGKTGPTTGFKPRAPPAGPSAAPRPRRSGSPASSARPVRPASPG